MDLITCPECRAFYQDNRDHLVAACASVGIEHGESSGAMLTLYLEGYHRDGHREPE
jgi:hypothetical protein